MEYPKVSFIIPARNEEKYIKDCIESLLSLDYPQDKVEIIFAEGNSNDRTREIIEEYAKKHKNIKVYDNPSGNTAIGRNICIENSTGDMLMNFSAHSIASKNLLKVLALKLKEQPENVAGVGCSNISPKKQNFVGRVAGATFLGFMAGSGIFMQNAVFKEEKYVEHMAFTLYRKEIFQKIGMFDPEFWCGQDAEFDIRVKKAGYKILYTPETVVYHFKRDTVKGLFKQLYRYGIARAKMIRKHPDTIKIFHLFPSLFVLGSLFFFILTIIKIFPLWLFLSLVLLYIALCLISTARVTKDIFVIITSVFFYLLIKISYGLGFIRGIITGKWHIFGKE
ncbi:MAG: glycosyltransferase family 2 protein [Thermoplasmata archaeon]|nr:glycosyltransferase family 2 protein [Thermoplasmata archaeon]